MLDGLNLLVSVPKFGIDTTKIVGIVSVSYRIDFEKAGIVHPYYFRRKDLVPAYSL